MPDQKMVPIPGSKKRPFRGARPIAPAPADERLEVTLRLRPRNPLPKAEDLLKPNASIQPLTHAEFENRYGADPKDIEQVKKFAEEHHLTVVRADPARRSVMLSGVVSDFNKAFGQNLKIYAYDRGTYRGRVGPVQVPEELAPIVEGVFGLDNRPVAKRHRPRPKSAAGSARAFTPVQVAKLYNFPPGVDGSGQTIGIIELGGGYFPQDLDDFFGALKLPTPTVIPVSVDGAKNSPTTVNSADAEVVLDIQVAGAVAPGARFVVYFAPNDATSKGFLDALTKAVHDTDYQPSVISISWGGAEEIPNTTFQTQFDQVLQEAAMLQITVCVASGDDGAADEGPRVWDGAAHVDFPSSSPFALACGGTRLIASGTAIKTESIWNQKAADLSAGPDGSFGSGGGGVSGAFPLPSYQQQAGVAAAPNPKGFKGRGVPDVSGDADPASGYKIQVDGEQITEGGTSAVAPLWAGLIALINQKLKGRVGFINPQLYSLPAGSGVFHDVVTGNNRVTYKKFKNVGYDAQKGWDPCSGLGSVDGTKLSQVLSASVQPASRARNRPRRAGRASKALSHATPIAAAAASSAAPGP
jgi:kumamolisin